MNETANGETLSETRGAFADGLTLIRFLLTPVIMATIIMGWPSTQVAVLATALLIIAAITDIFDDIIGGSERSKARKFGWFDDIADIVLIIGTLAALLFVVWKNGILGWAFAIPAFVIIGREVIIGLVKGFEFNKYGWPTTRWGWLKNALTILATCILLASPWLTAWLDMQRADDANLMQVFGTNSPHIWMIGQGVLWLAAAISLATGISLLRHYDPASLEGESADKDNH
jgi:phosphatidylglycerophosphate synthase